MASIFAYIAPLALILPVAPVAPVGDSARLLPEEAKKEPLQQSNIAVGWLMLDAMTSIPVQHQVRIERRLIIRISPRSPARQNLVADLPRPTGSASSTQVVERETGKCLPLKNIAAVQATQDNRLMLYLRDQRVMRADLEKKCSARDFYSGFYVEPRKDEQLCIKRDKLQSRTGAKCELAALKQLVVVGS